MQCTCTIMSSVVCPAVQYLSTWSHHKEHNFWKIVVEHKMCVLIFFTTFVWNICYSKKNWVRYHHIYTFFIRYTRHSYQIFMKLAFSEQIFRNYWNQISWKSVHLEMSCSTQMNGGTNGRTDVTEIIIFFSQFCECASQKKSGLCLIFKFSLEKSADK